MRLDNLSSWLQITANLGIIAGLILVGIQINQNTQMIRVQMLSEESARTAGIEHVYAGEDPAAVWAKGLEQPAELTFREQRILESLIWSTYENWAHSYRLYRDGVIGEEWKIRVVSEVAYNLDHVYGRAWWETLKEHSADGEIPEELRILIDDLLSESRDFHRTYHRDIMKRVREQIENREHRDDV